VLNNWKKRFYGGEKLDLGAIEHEVRVFGAWGYFQPQVLVAGIHGANHRDCANKI